MNETRIYFKNLLRKNGLTWLISKEQSRSVSSPQRKLEQLAAQQGITEDTDIKSIHGAFKGELDDEFFDLLKQQRSHK